MHVQYPKLKGPCFQTLGKNELITLENHFPLAQFRFHCCKTQINFTFATQTEAGNNFYAAIWYRSKTVFSFGSGNSVGRSQQIWELGKLWGVLPGVTDYCTHKAAVKVRWSGIWGTGPSRRVATTVVGLCVYDWAQAKSILTVPFVSHFFSRVETRPCLRLWHVLQLPVQKNLLKCNLW